MGNAQRKMDYSEQPHGQYQHYQQPTNNIMYMPITADTFFNSIRDMVKKEDLNRVEDKLEKKIDSNFIWLMSVIVTIGGGLASLMFYIITKLPH